MQTKKRRFFTHNACCSTGVLLAFLTLASPLLNAPQAAPKAPLKPLPHMVFHIDARPWKELLKTNGIHPDGRALSLLAHVFGPPCDTNEALAQSAWVSSTADRDLALRNVYKMLTEGNYPQEILKGGSALWIYGIAPDSSSLHVFTILDRVRKLARNGEQGYTPQQRDVLNMLMKRPPTVIKNAEVVMRQASPIHIYSIMGAMLNPNAAIEPGRPLELGADSQNIDFQAPKPPMNNEVANLHELVPPEDIALYSQPQSQACAISCATLATENPSVMKSQYCRAKPSTAQKLVGSED